MAPSRTSPPHKRPCGRSPKKVSSEAKIYAILRARKRVPKAGGQPPKKPKTESSDDYSSDSSDDFPFYSSDDDSFDELEFLRKHMNDIGDELYRKCKMFAKVQAKIAHLKMNLVRKNKN